MVVPINPSTSQPVPVPPVEVAFWRATFRDLKLHPNQLAIRVLAPVAVEVYRRTRRQWDAREPESQVSYRFEGVESADDAKARVAAMFRECIEPWQAFDAAGNLIEETSHA